MSGADARQRAESPPLVSVVIAVRGRSEVLGRCVDSLLHQESPPPFELLVCAEDGGVAEHALAGRFPDAHITVLSGRTPAAMRNAVIPKARGELLLFLDDDVVAEPHLLARLAEIFTNHPEAGVFGGPNTTPPGSTAFQVVQGAVLSSLIGSGPVRRRYGPHPASEPDERWFTLCNLAVRRELMLSFDERLVCAEENAVLEELTRRGVPMVYSPSLVVHHERRGSWGSFAAQMIKYGRGRGQLIARRVDAARPAVLVPLLFILYLFAVAFLLPATHSLLLLVPLLAYMLAVLANAAWIARTLRRLGLRAVVPAAGLTVTLHLCYGAGVGLGIAEGTSSTVAGPFAALTSRLELLRILVTRQLRLRMKRSLVGVIWPVVSPALLLVLYVFVFGGVFHVPIQRYPEFLFAGLLPWTFLTLTLSAAVSSLSVEAEMIRRAPFPAELIPVATTTAMSIYFVATLAVFVLYLGLSGHLAIQVLPALVVPVASLYLFVLAAALVLALVDVFNRDLRQVLGNLLTAWFFLVPIVYRQDMLGSQLRFLQSLDPANVIVGQFREILYAGRVARPAHLIQMIVVSLICFIAARTVFRRFTRQLPLRV